MRDIRYKRQSPGLKSKKTIAFAIRSGISARYFLRTGLLKQLLEHGFRILLLTPNYDEKYFQEEFSHPDVCIERLETDKLKSYLTELKWKKWNKIMRNLRYLCMYDLPSINFRYRMYRQTRGKRTFKLWLYDLILLVLHKSITARKLLLAIESMLFKPKFHREVFERHKPELLICGCLGFRGSLDRFLLREARSYGIRTLSIITNWDHPSTKGWRGATPNYTAAWSNFMKRELVEYHKYPAQRCFVTGPLIFDVHFKPSEWTREEFLRGMGLDPERKTIVFYTWEPHSYPYHPDIIKILGEAIKNGQFIEKVQLVVRLHFLWFTNAISKDYVDEFIELCETYPHVVIDKSPILSTKLNLDMPGSEMARLSALIRYSDVMLNFFSTASIEACIHDVPVVCIDSIRYGEAAEEQIKSSQYTHNLPFSEAGAARIVNSPQEELVHHINMYLENPGLDRENRLRVVQLACEYTDGHSADRMASVIKNIVSK